MAVEVIGVDDSVYKKTTCRNCASILRYVRADKQERRVSCMGDVDTVAFIVCPKCHNDVIVSLYE